MYEESAKRLRQYAATRKGEIAELTAEAADAIEDLITALTASNEVIAKSKPKWIPVTERLPNAAPGDVSEQVLVTDGEYFAIVEWFNFEECEPFWGYTGFGKDVTHWMQLPEPPREDKTS